ncbi:hypothetical protein [Mixta calida]|uniref:hypothetical protein n=1 Tax=Mixta calida TaxID=665913 RepID=UPI0028A72897|nr:hypothetical protein [Mixta calida]
MKKEDSKQKAQNFSTEVKATGITRMSRRKKFFDFVKNEAKEARNTITEATFNNLWHTPICAAIYAFVNQYLHYLLVLIPGLSPVIAAAAALYCSYIVAALLLSYLRRFTVWGAGKLKNIFGRK